MWNYKLYIILSLLIGGLTSCNRQQRDSVNLQLMSDDKAMRELAEAAEMVNKSCPVQADDRTTLVGATFKDKQWTYYYIVKEDTLVRFDNTALHEGIKRGIKESTRNHILHTPEMMTMIQALIKVKADLLYSYQGTTSGKEIKVVYSYPELRVIVDVMNYN